MSDETPDLLNEPLPVRPGLPGQLKLAVLNPGGKDPFQAFPGRAGSPGGKAHPPVNYHAYAACTGGSFHREISTVADDQQAVLLLLRRDLKPCLKALAALKEKGKTVAVSLKESGAHQVAGLLADAGRIGLFRQICSRADFCLSSTPDLAAFYRGAGARRVEYLPTPYPVDDPRWDFAKPASSRRGIFVGTREFDVPSRNHLAALLALRHFGAHVTVVNPDGRRGRRLLEALGFQVGYLRIVDGRMPCPDYLRLVSEHRFIFQLDRSAVPGQVAGDALLCRMPCVGGDGAVERTAFPELCGWGRTPAELLSIASRLARDAGAYAQAVEASQRLALEKLSFASAARELAGLFGQP